MFGFFRCRLILEDDFAWDLSLPSDGRVCSDSEDELDENNNGSSSLASPIEQSASPRANDAKPGGNPTWSNIVASSHSSSSTPNSSGSASAGPRQNGDNLQISARHASSTRTHAARDNGNVKTDANGNPVGQADDSERKVLDVSPNPEPILDNGGIKLSQRPGPLRRIAGVDISFAGDSDEDACAA